jgi:hypothetical protein
MKVNVTKTPTALNHMVVSSSRHAVDLLLSITKPNNFLSDKDVAIANIAGYGATMRLRNCPGPPIPLPFLKTRGSVLEAVLKH